MRPTPLCLFAFILLLSAPLAAQDEGAATGPSRCASPEYRQFDFWLGEWEVTSNGTPAGRNSIVATQGGCVLQENWQGAGPGGISGSSFNIYDRERRAWHQTWVDASGTLLLLDGGIVDSTMVMEGERPAPGGNGTVRHRIAWTPNEDGTVRQLWEASQDGGANWSVIFDGLYTPAEPVE